jgi:hypothetical protein
VELPARGVAALGVEGILMDNLMIAKMGALVLVSFMAYEAFKGAFRFVIAAARQALKRRNGKPQPPPKPPVKPPPFPPPVKLPDSCPAHQALVSTQTGLGGEVRAGFKRVEKRQGRLESKIDTLTGQQQEHLNVWHRQDPTNPGFNPRG